MDYGSYIVFTSKQVSDETDRFIKNIIKASQRGTFYQCTPVDKSLQPTKTMYMTPETCKMGKCMTVAVCVLNYVRTNPVNYRVYGIAFGYAGDPPEQYIRVADAPHTLAVVQSKITGELIAIDVTELDRSGKLHVFVENNTEQLLQQIQYRYGTYPGAFWTIYTEQDFKNIGLNIYSVYSSTIHKASDYYYKQIHSKTLKGGDNIFNKTEERIKIGNRNCIVYKNKWGTKFIKKNKEMQLLSKMH